MSQAWADQPYALIPTPRYLGTFTATDDAEAVNIASVMANVHNAILRGLNSIYLQSPHVPPNDTANFIGYCLTWCDFIEEHHHTEDTRFFLAIDAAAGGDGKSGMAINSQQHESFHEPMLKFHEYLEEAHRTGKFSGTEIQALIDVFGPALHNHLKEEIDTLLALRSIIKPADIRTIAKKERAAALKALSLNSALCMLMNVDATYEGGLHKHFPEDAFSAPLWVVKNMIGRIKCTGYWKYASCGRDGTPRPLYALGLQKNEA